jgi:hypothetical protein
MRYVREMEYLIIFFLLFFSLLFTQAISTAQYQFQIDSSGVYQIYRDDKGNVTII